MIKINLLPVRANLKKEKLRDQIIVTVVGLALVLAGCVAAYTLMLTKIGAKKDQIKQQQATIEQLKKQIGEVDKVKKLREELQAKLDVLAKLKASKSGPAHVLDELSNAAPDKLWFDTFDNIGGAMSMSGLAVSEEVVAGFLIKLEASPYVGRVELQSLEQAVIDGNKLHKFKITAREEVPVPVKTTEAAATEPNQQNTP